MKIFIKHLLIVFNDNFDNSNRVAKYVRHTFATTETCRSIVCQEQNEITMLLFLLCLFRKEWVALLSPKTMRVTVTNRKEFEACTSPNLVSFDTKV